MILSNQPTVYFHLPLHCRCVSVAGETLKIHEEIGGTVVRRFVNQELGKAGKLSAQGVAFLANIQAKLNMPQEVRGNLFCPPRPSSRKFESIETDLRSRRIELVA